MPPTRPGNRRPLHWVPVPELVEARAAIQDGHLRVLSARLAHAIVD